MVMPRRMRMSGNGREFGKSKHITRFPKGRMQLRSLNSLSQDTALLDQGALGIVGSTAFDNNVSV